MSMYVIISLKLNFLESNPSLTEEEKFVVLFSRSQFSKSHFQNEAKCGTHLYQNKE